MPTRSICLAGLTLLLALMLLAQHPHTDASSITLLESASDASVDETEPCGALGTIVTQPIVDPAKFCPEYLVEELPHSATAAVTSVAFAPSCEELGRQTAWCDALFFVRPDVGTLNWLGSYDPDTQQYAINTFASGLDTPNGLFWHQDAWLVAGDSAIYRLADNNDDNIADSIEIVVDDLPHSAGEWTGSIAVGPDDLLYVSQGASCASCQETDPRRAAIVSYDLTGQNETIFARGLHNAFDFAWHPVSGEMWTADSLAQNQNFAAPLDEINRLAVPEQHYGWPFCYSTTQGIIENPLMDDSDGPACQDTISPALTLSANSKPSGMVFYHGDAFPEYEGDLIIAASGGWNDRSPQGYALLRVCFDETGEPEACLDDSSVPLLTAAGEPTGIDVIIPTDVEYHLPLATLHTQGQSFYPEHPVDIAISPEGYLVIAILEGRLIQIRPAPGF